MANYWIGVGGFAIYSSSDTTIRFITLTKNASGAYGRNAKLSNLVMKTADGSEAMTDVYADGKLFNDYTDFVIKFDLSDLTAAKVEFTATYGGKTYYPFNGSTKVDSYTYNASPINFDPGERYMAMNSEFQHPRARPTRTHRHRGIPRPRRPRHHSPCAGRRRRGASALVPP